MTDFTPPPLPSASFQAPSASAPVQPKKSKKALWVVLICLLGIVIVGLIVFGAFKLVDSRTANIGDQPAINNTLVGFMQGMSAKNVNKAYSYLSDRGKTLWPKEKLQKLLDGNDYRLFEKFKSFNINNFQLSKSYGNTGEQVGAFVSGTANYSDGLQYAFESRLQKVDGKWLISTISFSKTPINSQNLQGPSA